MILTDKIWLGAAAGAVGMGAFGDKDRPIGDRLAPGAALGIVAGIGSSAIYSAAKKTGRLGLHGGTSYFSSMSSKYVDLTKAVKNPYTGLTKAGMGPLAATFHAYGTRGVFTGLGAVIGASVAGEDHRAQGAAIGGGIGFAARSLIGGAHVYKEWGTMHYPKFMPKTFMGKTRNAGQSVSRPGGKLALIAGLSALAFVAGAALSNHDHVTAASYNAGAEAGYDAYDPGSAPDSGIQERVKNIGAHGDVVLGSHGARHG